MPLTVRDAESSYLSARAQVEQWKSEFIQSWLQPEFDLAVLAMAAKMDPYVIEHLRASDPKAWRAFEQRVKEAQARLQNGPTE